MKILFWRCNVWSIAQRSTDLMFMLALNKTIDQLAMANSVKVWACVLERGWSCLEQDIRS